MPTSKRELKMVVRVLERSEERSTLFWWMLEHHNEMAKAAGAGRPRWGQLCERFAVLGLKDGHGKSPSPEAARRTWRHVREVVAKVVKNRPSVSASRYPSRISPNWRPPVVEQPRSTTSAGPLSPPSPAMRSDSFVGERRGLEADEVVEFSTVDPSGAPLPEGHVFYRGRPMLRRVAEQLARIHRQAKEMDRFK